MDSDLSSRVRACIDESRKLIVESRCKAENARLLIGRQRRRATVEVKEVNDIVLVIGLPSQERALHLCGQIKKWGIKSTIGMLPGVAGYQVSIYRVNLVEVKAMLAQIGFDIRDGG